MLYCVVSVHLIFWDHVVVVSAVGSTLVFFSCLTWLIEFCCFLRLFSCRFKAYEKQKQTQKSSTQLESKSGEREKVEKFKVTENSIVSKPINPFMLGNDFAPS